MPKFVKAGKLYDTDTATQIGTIKEVFVGGATRTLYVTPKRTFFMHSVSHTLLGERLELIQPLTLYEARTWAEGYLDVQAVCRFFEIEAA